MIEKCSHKCVLPQEITPDRLEMTRATCAALPGLVNSSPAFSFHSLLVLLHQHRPLPEGPTLKQSTAYMLQTNEGVNTWYIKRVSETIR